MSTAERARARPDRFLVCHGCDCVALKAPHLSSLCWVADFLSGKFLQNRISTSRRSHGPIGGSRNSFPPGATSLAAIASREGVTDRYVARLIRLAFLAPKIVEAIAERGELADLKLTPHVDLPLDWTTQKRVVGLE